MIRIFIGLALIMLLSAKVAAQKAVKGLPTSMQLPVLKSTSSIPEIVLTMPAYEQLSATENQLPARYGVYKDTIIDFKNSARIDRLTGDGSIWRLNILCPEAKSIQIFFSKFHVPEHSRLFLYDSGMKRIAGAFTSANNQGDSIFTIADFEGNQVILEYFEPLNPNFEGELIIGSIGLGFSDPLFPEAGPGFININCPIGKDAQLAKHAVCKMSFRSGSYQVTCSGALINNARNDGTPYFLTANHCLSTQEEAASLVTYFNYENAGCNGSLGESPTLTGSNLLATGKPSDFTLLELNDVPPPEYQPFYGGWDARNEPVKGVIGIHVPYNESKKISLDYDSIYSNPVSVVWDDESRSPVGSHWIVGFDDGGTSQGSSGSPLFNLNNQIIGQLHGGDDEMAYYGKFSYSFTYKAPGFHTMRHYLDPDSTDITSVEGYAPSDNLPDAFFTTNFEQVCHFTPITFSDLSVFGPYQREWTIKPSNFVYTSGTDSASENPVIEFQQDTIYLVTLKLSAGDSVVSAETMEISSGPDIDISVISEASSEICDCDFDSFGITAQGADDFFWSILPGNENKIAISDTTGEKITVSRVPAFEADSSYQVGLLVTGTQATCADTLEVVYNLLRQVNDDIVNAIALDYGISKTYSNTCATVEDGEPIPPFVSCTTQDSWCDEYGTGEDIVENSVWFKFIAGTTGKVSISSTGMDNQIALYEADSYQDILDGHYTLLGANDDRTDADYRPLLRSETVHPGDTYYLQVDGSGGGLEDDFYITITQLTVTANNEVESDKMLVYPQPAYGNVHIYHPDWINESKIKVNILNSAGIIVVQSDKNVSNGTVSVNVDDLTPGFYLFTAETRKGCYVTQIVKR